MKAICLGLFLLLAAPLEAAPVRLAWEASTGAVTGYRVLYGPAAGQEMTTVDVGLVLTATLDLPPGTYYFVAVAYDATGAVSPKSNEVSTTVPPGGPPTCAITIAVQSYSQTVSRGLQGTVLFTFTPTPSARVTNTEVRLGTQVASVQVGVDLRSTAGQQFSVPNAVGTYNLTVWAKDANGCEGLTTLARPVAVQ